MKRSVASWGVGLGPWTAGADWRLHRHAFVLTDERDRLDRGLIVGFLRDAYWARGKPDDVIWSAILGSHPYGLFAPDGAQAGFVRVISDGVMFAWIGDLFVLPAYRRRGLAAWTIYQLLHASRFKDVPNRQLSTRDHQTLYQRAGFNVFEGNGNFMTCSRPAPWSVGDDA